MCPALDFKAVAPDANEARQPLLRYFDECTIPSDLLELVKLRVSQMNGCAYCVDKHTRELREMAADEDVVGGDLDNTDEVVNTYLASVVAWRDAPFFTERERIALEWAEAVTNINREEIPEALHDEVADEFTERELVDLTFAVAAMNMSNMISVPFHRSPEIE